jgi:hypothetical protein
VTSDTLSFSDTLSNYKFKREILVQLIIRSTPSSGAEIFISSSVESLGIKSDNLCIHNRLNGCEFTIIH